MALDAIVQRKRQDVQMRKLQRPLQSFAAQLQPSSRSLRAALQRPGGGAYILECKKASPSRGLIRADFDPVALALQYAQVADAISVLADQPFFGGSLEYVRRVSQAVQVPVLCKDFVVDPYQVPEARLHGADAILLMTSVLQPAALALCLETARAVGIEALVEVHDEAQLALALDLGARLIGINNRDLRTLDVDLAVTERLAPLVPDGVTVVSESGLQDHRDVLRLRQHVDAFLVGSSLMQRADVGHAARELIHGRVKVCGLTEPADARDAWQAGAAWGGLIFAPQSPRQVALPAAQAIRDAAPLHWAGVFVNAEPDTIERAVDQLGLAAVQLHGDESPADLRNLRMRLPPACQLWKAVRVDGQPLPTAAQASADRLLAEACQPGLRGGTGIPFDWTAIAEHPDLPQMLLAGGLNPANADAASRVGAWALDVNSGVESAPGRKDPRRLTDFFAALRARPARLPQAAKGP